VSADDARLVATLWQLAWNDDRLVCVVYRHGGRFHLSLESPSGVIMTEQFDLQPRSLARAHALRDSLKRRGWHELA
jgi:hypothetical protein